MTVKDLLWQAVANVVTIPAVRRYLITRAFRTPYFHLAGYMNRWWLFNSYGFKKEDEATRHESKFKWLPAIRVHHILREDVGRHLHDHPWDARTIILDGYYEEERMMPDGTTKIFYRMEGDTATLNYGEYHTIKKVSPGGVWTLFMTWPYKGTWGFLVDGEKIQWRKYEEMYPENTAAVVEEAS